MLYMICIYAHLYLRYVSAGSLTRRHYQAGRASGTQGPSTCTCSTRNGSCVDTYEYKRVVRRYAMSGRVA